MSAPCLTFLCPRCRQTSVADRDEDGFPICGWCEPRDFRAEIMALHDRTIAALKAR